MNKISSIILLIVLGFALHSVSAKEARRIITLSPHAVEMLYAIGAGDRIVGTVEWSDFPAEAKKIEKIGNYAGIQIERIVELKPDLIVAWRSGNKLADLNKLESLGLKMVYSKPKTIKEIGDELIELGELTGLVDEAKQVAKKINEKRQKIISTYANQSKVKVFYQLWHDPLRTVGPKSWINSLVKDCNAENIFEDTDSDYPLVSLESVLIKNPQVIVIPSHSGKVDEKKNIWQKWQAIEAVKNKNIFHMNGDLLHRFSPRAVDGLEKLCDAINHGRPSDS